MQRAEILIVGGGILGLALARELAGRGFGDILIIEKEPELGRHASGRNSGVLHAGIYYAAESLKARYCLEGNRAMKDYCRQRELPLMERGKVIVARDESELPTLRELHDRALANGAKVELIDEKQLNEIEPAARTAGTALFSHYTAQVDPKAVLNSFQSDLEASGAARFRLGCSFLGLQGSSVARTSAGPIRFNRFINCAGSHCDTVARAFGLAGHLRLIPFKGIYRKLSPAAGFTVRANIYPVPDIRNPFLGVHFTRSIHGDVYLGPTAIPALGRENYGVLAGADREAGRILLDDAAMFLANPRFRQVALTEPRKYLPHFFFRDARRLVKSLHPGEVLASPKAGIRPQLVDWRSKELLMDFMVQADGPSLHLLNPISPAFTCSLALARSIADQHFPA